MDCLLLQEEGESVEPTIYQCGGGGLKTPLDFPYHDWPQNGLQWTTVSFSTRFRVEFAKCNRWGLFWQVKIEEMMWLIAIDLNVRRLQQKQSLAKTILG